MYAFVCAAFMRNKRWW